MTTVNSFTITLFPAFLQSRRTRVKHSEGCSARNKLPRQGRRCARLLPGMGAITAHWPAAHQRRHNPKLKHRNHGRGPRASSMIGFLGNRQVRRKRCSPSDKSGSWPSFTAFADLEAGSHGSRGSGHSLSHFKLFSPRYAPSPITHHPSPITQSISHRCGTCQSSGSKSSKYTWRLIFTTKRR